MKDSELELRPYRAGDEVAILQLFEQVFGRPLALDHWLWRFRDAPDGPAIVELAWQGDRLVGHYAISRVSVYLHGAALGSGLSGTTMTSPDVRGIGLFPKLARRVYRAMVDSEISLVWGFPNAASHRGFVRDLDWLDIYQIPVLRLDLARERPRARDGSEVRLLPGFDPRFDRLWQFVKDEHPVIACRDRRHLEWRYASKPDGGYRVLGYVDGEQLRGYAIIKRHHDELQVVDILPVTSDEVGIRLIEEAVRLGLEESAAAVGLWLNVALPLHRDLEKLGFRPSGPVTYFCGRLLSDGVPGQDIYDHRCWYLTMGDSDVY